VERDGLETPDNMARAAYIGKALQFLPKVYELVADLEVKAAEKGLDEGELAEVAKIKGMLEDYHLG